MAESRVAARLRWIDTCRARYQNCGSLEVPAEALESWTEHELTMFFESMGMIKPQTAAEKALADAQWREKLITEKEERLWRSAEAEGVALVVREIDREAEKRAHKALARARAWTAVELAARPRRWRRAGVRSRSKSPDPARRITKRDVDRVRSRTRGRARLEDSDSESSSSSEEEWRPRGIQPRAVRLMLAAEAAPAVHFRSRRRKLGVFDLARRAACRAVLARPPADGHFYAPMDGIVDTAAAVAEETAWLAFGTARRAATMAAGAADACAGMTRVVLTPLAPLDAPAAAPLDAHGRTLLALERRARRKEPPPPPPVARPRQARVTEPPRAAAATTAPPAGRKSKSPGRKSRSPSGGSRGSRSPSAGSPSREGPADGLERRWCDQRRPEREPRSDDDDVVALVKRPNSKAWSIARPSRRGPGGKREYSRRLQYACGSTCVFTELDERKRLVPKSAESTSIRPRERGLKFCWTGPFHRLCPAQAAACPARPSAPSRSPARPCAAA